ncbi:MAG: HD domain-containing protein [Fimbriimonas sp.]
MSPETRERILALATARDNHLNRLAERPSGLAWCARHSEIADDVVRLLLNDLTIEHPSLPPIALIATGGYGRRELAPHSDIDITVVPEDETSPALDAALRQLFQDLHWAFCTALRLDVGYAYRLVSDAPGLDATSRTGLLDMRHLAGSYDVTRRLEQALHDSFAAGEFILAKITERRAAFAKHHDTPLVVEPHLKEGAGGVRCFHCANWIREAVGDRPARPTEAYDTIIRFRNLLQLRAGKALDVLSRPRQAEIADMLGVDVYEMTSQIAERTSELHDEYRRATQRLHEGRFNLSRHVLAVNGEARPVGQADPGQAAVGLAIATKLGLRVSDLPVACRPVAPGPAALYAVTTGESTLRNLDKCGLLAELLPELDACRTLMPADTVHTFTVFEHTLRTVRHLDALKAGTFLGDLKDSINDLEPLYLGALLHDIGKAVPSRPHSEIGAEMAADICRRWGLNENTAEDVEWLVREHLTMARFIRVRDVENPATVQEFADLMGTVNRLHLLTLLTWADVNAVSAGAWTPAQETFLRTLHARTEARLQGEVPGTPDPSLYRQRLLRQLRGKQEDEGAVQAFVGSLPAHYVVSTPPDVIRLHMGFAQQAIEGQPTVELFHRADLGATDFTVCSLDAPGLLSRLLGVFYAYDLSVAGIRASTTQTAPAVALDVFTVSFSGRPVPAATCKQVSSALLDVAEGRREVEDVLRSKGKDPFRKQRVFSYQFIEGTPSVLEIRAPRGRGMAFRFSQLIAEAGWNVVSARVGQWAGNAAAAFYLLDSNGNGLTKEQVDAKLRDSDLA